MDADAYLSRIGLGRRPPPTLEGLTQEMLAHLLAVPFENLDIAAGRPIELGLPALFDKIVTRRRGGFCYELNGLFAWLLAELGFAVTLLSGRTVGGVHGELGPEFDHLVLRVDLDEPVLVDVGWGEAYRRPLALRDGASHVDPLIAEYRLEARTDGCWDIWEHTDDGVRVAYRFDLVPRALPDFADTCRWQQTESPFFTGHRVCTIATPDGRRTLMDNRLISRSAGERAERTVAEHEVDGLLATMFGVRL